MNRIAVVVAVVVSSMQLAWAFCPNGSVEWKGACSADIKSIETDPRAVPSEEKPPRSANHPWESGDIQIVDLKPVNPADEHHPPSCPVNCHWDGGTCDCKSEDDSNGKPTALNAK